MFTAKVLKRFTYQKRVESPRGGGGVGGGVVVLKPFLLLVQSGQLLVRPFI